MIKPMSLASIASDAGVLIIEVHDKKEEAFCDKEQALTIKELEDILNDIKRVKGVVWKIIKLIKIWY